LTTLGAIEKLDYTVPKNNDSCYGYRKNYDKDFKNGTDYFDVRWQQIPRLKNIVGPVPILHKQLR